MKFWNLMIAIVGIFLASQISYGATQDSSQWQSTIEQIKAQTNSLLKENEKLNSEYEFLQEKITGLKADLEKSRSTLKAQEKQNKELKKFKHDQDKGRVDWSSTIGNLQNDVDHLQSHNQQLEHKLADVEEQNRLWRMKSATLENEKRELSLDAGYAQIESLEDASDTKNELQDKLKESLKTEKELKAQLARLKAKNRKAPGQSAMMKKENQALQSRIKQLKKDIVKQQIANEKKIKQAKAKPGNSSPSLPADLLKERRELNAEVSRLTTQLNEVNQSVARSQDVLKRKRALMDQIMRMDAENQELRAKIDAADKSK